MYLEYLRPGTGYELSELGTRARANLLALKCFIHCMTHAMSEGARAPGAPGAGLPAPPPAVLHGCCSRVCLVPISALDT